MELSSLFIPPTFFAGGSWDCGQVDRHSNVCCVVERAHGSSEPRKGTTTGSKVSDYFISGSGRYVIFESIVLVATCTIVGDVEV